MTPADVQQALDRLTRELGRVVFGAEEQVRLAFVALLAKGHVLFEGVPGTGKTLLARCFARALGLGLRRLQCTPDLMPGDVLGANIFDFQKQAFSLTRGPVFTEFLLVDEVNRMPPKTQSALLEAMQERAVTIDGHTHALPRRFTVFATQNPVEHEGTYPLPEAQLDRFLFKLDVGYPAEEQELLAVVTHSLSSAMPDLDALGLARVLTNEELDALLAVPLSVAVDQKVAAYAVALARATRSHSALAVGLSPRATTMLTAAGRAAAASAGRGYTLPDDLKELFLPLGRHRVVLSTVAEMEGQRVDAILQEIVEQVPAPR